MDINSFKANTDKERYDPKPEKVVNAVVTGAAKKVEKSKARKFIELFVAEDVTNVKSYVLKEVFVPAVKKVIAEIVNTTTDMFLYGEGNKNGKRPNASRYSYNNPNVGPARTSNASSRIPATPDYNDILLNTRGDAEAVLDSMCSMIEQYGTVSVADLYDLASVPNDNYTLNRYGWADLRSAQVVRVRDGYMIRLPRAVPL